MYSRFWFKNGEKTLERIRGIKILNDGEKPEKKEFWVYIWMLLFAGLILWLAMISQEVTIEMISVKLVNLSIAGVAVYLIKTFDFIGVDFTDAIKKNNIAAAIVFASICFLVGLVLGSG